MVEVERVMDAILERPLTVAEIAEQIGCSKDAVSNVLLLVTARKSPKLYVSIAKGGAACAYTLTKPLPGDERNA